MLNIFRNLNAVFCCILITVSCYAQQSLSPKDTLKLNPIVRYGILENGFTYYIVKTNNQEKNVSFNFVEKAGNLQYDEGELGVAHFIEHLSFRSTVNFPSGVLNYMTRSGLVNGKDLNGSTGTETIYFVNVPSNDSTLKKNVLLAMRDYAKGRLYLPQEVEEERAAVLREIALADNKIFFTSKENRYLLLDKHHPIFDPRLLSKEKDIITNVSVKTLIQYDDKWYRPDLQAIIIVGNVDENEIEEDVKALFSDLKEQPNAIPLTKLYEQFIVPLTGKDKLIVLNHISPSDQHIMLEIMKKRKSISSPGGPITIAEVRQKLIDDLYNELSTQRFQNLMHDERNSSVNFSHTISRRAIYDIAGIDALHTRVSITETSQIKNAVQSITTELHRVKLWGFTRQEFEKALFILKNKLQQESKSQRLSDVTLRLVLHFAHGAAFPENELDLKLDILDKISLKEINILAKTWLSENGNTTYAFSKPLDKNIDLPNLEEINSWIDQVEKKPIGRLKDKKEPTLPKVFNRKVLSKDSIISDVNVTLMEISNGLNVFIKPVINASKNSKIYLKFFSNSKLMLKDKTSADFNAMINYLGVGRLNSIEVKEWIKNKNTTGYLDAYIELVDNQLEFNGSCSLENYEALLQLAYFYFTQPNLDKQTFLARSNVESPIKDTKTGSRVKFENYIDSIIHGENLFIKQINNNQNIQSLEKAFNIYRNETSITSNFTVVIAGNFNVNDIESLTKSYLGALPNSKIRNSTGGNILGEKNETNFPKRLSRQENSSMTMVEDSVGNVRVRMLFPINGPFTKKERLALNILKESTAELLFQRLRVKEKGVYSVVINLRTDTQNPTSYLDIDFETAPENVGRLVDATREEISNFSNTTLVEPKFKAALNTVRIDETGKIASPRYWSEYLFQQLKSGRITDNILQVENILDTINTTDLKNTAAKFIDTNHYMLFKLL